MAKSADEALKELIGTFVLQNLQLQILATQLSEDKASLQEQLKVAIAPAPDKVV